MDYGGANEKCRMAFYRNCSCGLPLEGPSEGHFCRFLGVLEKLMPRAHVAKTGGRASALLLFKSSGFSILPSTVDFSGANPKTDPLCPRHRNVKPRMCINSICFFYLKSHRLPRENRHCSQYRSCPPPPGSSENISAPHIGHVEGVPRT
jgi:hypothetical protein